MDDAFELEFTTDELCFLLGLFGPCITFGLGDPYLGKLADEVQTAMTKAQQSLTDRDYVRIAGDGEIALDRALAGILETCARPHHTAIVTTQQTDGPRRVFYLHFSPDLIVEHAVEGADRHCLTPYPDHAAVVQHLTELLHLDRQQAAPGQDFQIAESALFQARDLFVEDKEQEGKQILQDAGLDLEQTALLAGAFKNPISNSSVVVVINRKKEDMQHVSGLGTFESNRGAWAMTPRSDPSGTTLKFIPSSAREMCERLSNILP